MCRSQAHLSSFFPQFFFPGLLEGFVTDLGKGGYFPTRRRRGRGKKDWCDAPVYIENSSRPIPPHAPSPDKSTAIRDRSQNSEVPYSSTSGAVAPGGAKIDLSRNKQLSSSWRNETALNLMEDGGATTWRRSAVSHPTITSLISTMKNQRMRNTTPCNPPHSADICHEPIAMPNSLHDLCDAYSPAHRHQHTVSLQYWTLGKRAAIYTGRREATQHQKSIVSGRDNPGLLNS
ncbi:hypothetical protein C8R43DRAFT_529463 [Mycena crocata]|nr:hypothetical protein C8R43DRAFT_529463 [Mycena crocata]